MIIKVTGTITAQGALRQGVSQSSGNQWATQSFMVKDERGNDVCFEVFGMDNISKFQVGQSISIDCTVTGREYNGRLYNDVRYLAPRQESVSAPTPQPQVQSPQPTTQVPPVAQPHPNATYAQPYVQPQPQVQQPQVMSMPNTGDLPF
jgi:hypothetical protein